MKSWFSTIFCRYTEHGCGCKEVDPNGYELSSVSVWGFKLFSSFHSQCQTGDTFSYLGFSNNLVISEANMLYIMFALLCVVKL